MYAEYPSPIINITNHIITDKDLGDFNNLHIMLCQKYMAILQPSLITHYIGSFLISAMTTSCITVVT